VCRPTICVWRRSLLRSQALQPTCASPALGTTTSLPIVRPIAIAVSVSGLHRPPRWQRSTSPLVPALAAIHSWANNTRLSPFAATSNVEANKRHEYEAPWRRSTRHFASSLQPSTTSGELQIILTWSSTSALSSRTSMRCTSRRSRLEALAGRPQGEEGVHRQLPGRP
jgi:hypothetical protein